MSLCPKPHVGTKGITNPLPDHPYYRIVSKLGGGDLGAAYDGEDLKCTALWR
jgi:hypothetical protein